MIEIDDHGDVRELRLARPPANALDAKLVATLSSAVAAAPNQGARAIVLSGRPGMYSGGLDVPALVGLDRAAMSSLLGDFLELLRRIALSELPIVAAISGHAPAGGAVLAIHCDYRVMAAGEYKIGLNEVQVGLPLPQSLHSVLARVVGRRHAERLSVGGLLVDAEEALRIGLVDELVPVDRVTQRALDIARGYLALPPTAMRRTRELARRDLATIFEREQQATWDSFVDDWFSTETQASLRALVERLEKKKRGKGDSVMSTATSSLAQRSCEPCKGGVPPLEGERIERLLDELGPNGWKAAEEHHLEKEYEFDDFVGALDFVNRVGEIAEQEGHHPDIYLTYGKVGIKIWTHKIDGLTESDFVLAAKCDAVREG